MFPIQLGDGWERSPHDPLCCPHYPVQGLAVSDTALPKPDNETAAEDAFDGTSVEHGKDGREGGWPAFFSLHSKWRRCWA